MEMVTGVVVPYTDAMRLCRGFNSYTLEPCLYDCVSGSQARNQDRSVNYKAMVVSKPSDVARALNIPFYPSMKRGSLSFNDAVSPVDEVEFTLADVNFLVIINVETQRLSIATEKGGLRLRDGIQPSSLVFNETYGDSYISQYIAGGTAAVVLSVRVLDKTRVEETVKAIKGSLDLNDQEASVKLILNAYGKDTLNAFSTALKGTKSHASASCIGNGNLITGVVGIDKVLASVSNFPNTVSTTSGWTWAVLTRYHMDPSLVKSLGSSGYATLKYDQAEGVSTGLLDNFMCFKALLRDLKAIMVDCDNFEQSKDDNNPIEVSFEALLGVQSKMRQELWKIIEAIEVVSRDPWSHKRHMSRKQWQGPQPASDLAVVARPAATGPNAVDLDNEAYAHSTVVGGAEQLTFDFSSLLTPDVWKRSMPISKLTEIIDANNTSKVAQSSEAMGREHKQKIDVLLVTHNNEVQKVTNGLNHAHKTLSEKESMIQQVTNDLKVAKAANGQLEKNLANARKDVLQQKNEAKEDVKKLREKGIENDRELTTARARLQSNSRELDAMQKAKESVEKERDQLRVAKDQAEATSREVAKENKTLKEKSNQFPSPPPPPAFLPLPLNSLPSVMRASLERHTSKGNDYSVGAFFGELKKPGPGAFNALDRINLDWKPNRIKCHVNHKYIKGLEVGYFNGQTLYYGVCNGADHTPEIWLEAGESITGVYFETAFVSEFGTECLVKLGIYTSKSKIYTAWSYEAATDGPKQAHSAPLGYSLCGFCGQCCLAIDRIAPIWGKIL